MLSGVQWFLTGGRAPHPWLWEWVCLARGVALSALILAQRLFHYDLGDALGLGLVLLLFGLVSLSTLTAPVEIALPLLRAASPRLRWPWDSRGTSEQLLAAAIRVVMVLLPFAIWWAGMRLKLGDHVFLWRNQEELAASVARGAPPPGTDWDVLAASPWTAVRVGSSGLSDGWYLVHDGRGGDVEARRSAMAAEFRWHVEEIEHVSGPWFRCVD